MNRVSNIQFVLGDKTNSLDENLIKQDFGVWTVSLILVFCRVCQHGCGPPVSIYIPNTAVRGGRICFSNYSDLVSSYCLCMINKA